MLWLATRVSTREEPELMEQPGLKPCLLAGSLSDLDRINRWFGGTRLTLWGMEQLAGRLSPGGALSVLDVASGGADIPEAVFRWARRRGLDAEIVASDYSLEILAQVPYRRRSVLRLLAADALRLPFADRSFDVSTCSLVMHHFDPEGAVALLGELHRVARYGIVVNDLVRSRHGYLGAWLAGHLLTRNPITRHDATLSVRRAYTRAEMKHLARRAELGPVRFAGFLGYRVAMVAGGGP
jgi:ubiquinone/menaquinone biosynthesis C-methylase UbiE